MLKGRKVEQNRIEYKEGFNPSDIVHTICAYANDIAGVDGGCLVICVKAENGLPVLPSIGLPSELLDDIQLKIFQYCNKIELRYIPKIDIVEYQGAYLVYLNCAAGDAGSYQALVDLYSKEESGKEQNRTMKYWIRPASLTTEAKQSELAELFEKFASIPFVDCINSWASMAHIRRGYLEDFIRESNSSLIEELNVRLLKDLMEKFAAGKVRAIVNFMEEHGGITPKEAEAVTGKSAATVRRYFKILADTRHIVAEGNTNNIVYRSSMNLPEDD